MELLETMCEALMRGRAPEVKELVEKALAEKIEPGTILTEGLLKGMGIIGAKFKKNEVYVPEVLIAARAMNAGMDILKPELVAAGVEPVGTAVIGTVKGDLHDIGKNLVSSMLEGAGFEIVDLGVDVAPEKFVESVSEGKVNVVCLSALLTTTMPAMKTTIDALVEAGVRDKVKIIIGGAPVTQQYADEVGADGYGDNANSAVTEARKLIGV